MYFCSYRLGNLKLLMICAKSKAILILAEKIRNIIGHLFLGFIPHNYIEGLPVLSETYTGTSSIADKNLISKSVKLFWAN